MHTALNNPSAGYRQSKHARRYSIHELICGLINQTGRASFMVTGHSMFPFLPNQSHVVISACCNAAEIRTGDIVFFRFYNTYRLHRVIKIQQRLSLYWFLTRGDWTTRTDGWIGEDQLIGKVIATRLPKWLGEVSIDDTMQRHLDKWVDLIWPWCLPLIRPVTQIALGLLRRFLPNAHPASRQTCNPPNER